jgi:hypothetical protein
MVASIASDTAYVSGSRSAKPGEKRRPAVRRTISARPSARTWAARVRQNSSEYCAAAQAITAAQTRSGYAAASACATAPPKDRPTIANRSTPIESIRRTTSSANPVTVHRASGTGVLP